MTDLGRDTADVVIIGGAMIGSSIAWWLSRDPAFDGRIVVIERDPTYAMCSTAHTNSCIRQQFTSPVNIRISQFGAAFIRNVRDWMGEDAPEIMLRPFGYLYLAATERQAEALREAQAIQAAHGAATRLLSPGEIAAAYPFYALDGIVLGSHGPVDEGVFDGATLFDSFRRYARAAGVEYRTTSVTGIDRSGSRVTGVRLADGGRIDADVVVNATGPRAAITARMAGLDLPVVPRRRFTWVFEAAQPLGQDLPLTIDPSGVHVRSEGNRYLCGCPPETDLDMDPEDFSGDADIWMNKVWPALARRIPAFEAIRVTAEWVGHYAYNTVDQNALLGALADCDNFLMASGFSGHGLQQSPAVGRGIAELIVHGRFTSLDLSDLAASRLARGQSVREMAII